MLQVWVLGIGVIVILVQVLGKCMIIKKLDLQGKCSQCHSFQQTKHDPRPYTLKVQGIGCRGLGSRVLGFEVYGLVFPDTPKTLDLPQTPI